MKAKFSYFVPQACLGCELYDTIKRLRRGCLKMYICQYDVCINHRSFGARQPLIPQSLIARLNQIPL